MITTENDDLLQSYKEQQTNWNSEVATDTQKQYDAMVTVAGGGVTGQSEAVRHGISRALVAANPDFRGALKKAGLLKRDSRMVERKKYGRHKARRSTQFSKR